MCCDLFQLFFGVCGGERDASGGGGEIVAVLTSEVDALGGFAGSGPSRAASNLFMLIGAMGYMFWVDPTVALAGLLLIAP